MTIKTGESLKNQYNNTQHICYQDSLTLIGLSFLLLVEPFKTKHWASFIDVVAILIKASKQASKQVNRQTITKSMQETKC